MSELTQDTIAPKVMLQGVVSTGKSFAVRTLVIPGRETFVLQTEPSEVLDDIPCSQGLHLARAFPAQVELQTLIENARRLNTMSMKALQEMVDPNRHKYGQFIDLLNQLHNFTCYRCKQSFGDFSDWKSNRTLVIDGMSGLSQMSLDLVVGSKPIKTQPEWGAAMDNLERLIQMLCMNAYAMFVLLGHVEREPEEITGGVKNMVATLGRKLAPKLVRPFSDIVKTYRDVGPTGQPVYWWSTFDVMSELKNRNLPFSPQIKPDFKQIVDAWQGRITKAAQMEQAANAFDPSSKKV
jgi:hypothetical protein